MKSIIARILKVSSLNKLLEFQSVLMKTVLLLFKGYTEWSVQYTRTHRDLPVSEHWSYHSIQTECYRAQD